MKGQEHIVTRTTLPARVSVERIEQLRRAAYWCGLSMVDIVDEALAEKVAKLEAMEGARGRRHGHFKEIPNGERLQMGRRAKVG